MPSDQSLKKDAGKVPLELIDVDAQRGLGAVLGFGTRKYKAHGWRAGMEWSRLIGAALRHLYAFASGEENDPESGLPHIDHLACCVMFLSAYQKQRLGIDDRVKTARMETVEQECSRYLSEAKSYAQLNVDANGSPTE